MGGQTRKRKPSAASAAGEGVVQGVFIDTTAPQRQGAGQSAAQDRGRKSARSSTPRKWLWLSASAVLATIGMAWWWSPGAASSDRRHKPPAFSHNAKSDVQFGPTNGVFSRGCKWRDVQRPGQRKKMWAVEEYQFWDEESASWSSTMPAECQLQGEPNPPGWAWKDGSPRSQVWCDDYSCIYQNLWYNNGRWYLLVGDGQPGVDWWAMSRNNHLHVLHVRNTSAFVSSVEHRVVTGDTLVLDFTFFLHPTAIGHWGEMMFPLFSVLKRDPTFATPPAQFVLLHLKRVHLMEWARAIIAATLGLGARLSLPRILMQQEQDSIWNQIQQPLEGTSPWEWVCFERSMVVLDLYSGGVRTFLTQEDARTFRARIYANHGLPAPEWRVPPRVITFQRKSSNRRVVNEEQLIRLLQNYGQVQVVEFDAGTPFRQQLEVISRSGVFVSVHTSNLANAQWLQPGSAVFEIIQRNWMWAEMDLAFKRQTEMMGDIHHFAWRAVHRNQTVYLNQRDGERFGDWPADYCDTEDCVEAHTNVDVVVDLQQFKQLLDSRLPLVFAGASVASAELPWPGREGRRPGAPPEPSGDLL